MTEDEDRVVGVEAVKRRIEEEARRLARVDFVGPARRTDAAVRAGVVGAEYRQAYSASSLSCAASAPSELVGERRVPRGSPGR
jgi:hypothetical protein